MRGRSAGSVAPSRNVSAPRAAQVDRTRTQLPKHTPVHTQTSPLLATSSFFGGIKLGSGGLVRAYGGAAQQPQFAVAVSGGAHGGDVNPFLQQR